ncbi:uncharacterized protein PHACADRAFT_184741 [Phanerochaete carnosa HHB-10118-sp]|uniref:Uncharacterized protein n=1 Tax=Phanerochaete carnosa (strain HHB-10118-sp) TaxID=650164 RepID=K5VWU3_PHACS|nr:uncharacterized protein PHACADRAFT_184741 [Phanerochaete carnosa HHB-10118-sp]EKM56028.1 hypothetical protein PHACADRAFT_184741 [Phanerochaete carnosa HHB-10118-sp]
MGSVPIPLRSLIRIAFPIPHPAHHVEDSCSVARAVHSTSYGRCFVSRGSSQPETTYCRNSELLCREHSVGHVRGVNSSRCTPQNLPPDYTAYNLHVVRTRSLLRQILPSRVVDRIFSYTYCLPTISQSSGRRIAVDDDILVLAIPLTQAQSNRIMHVSLLIRSHDQGWIPGPDRLSNRPWTWFTMCTEGRLDIDVDGGPRLVTNRRGDPDTQSYEFEWNATSAEVCRIQEGRKIEIWAHARYFEWENVVEEAKITIHFQLLVPSPAEQWSWIEAARLEGRMCSSWIFAHILRDCFSNRTAAIELGKSIYHPRSPPPASKYLDVCENGIVLRNSLALYTPYLCSKLNDSTHTHRSFAAVIQGMDCEPHLHGEERQRVLKDVRDLLSNTAERIHLPSGTWPNVSKEVIMSLSQLSFSAPQSVTIKIFTSMWQDPDGSGLLLFFAGLHEQDRLDEESAVGQLCKEVLVQASSDEAIKCLEQSCHRLQRLLDGKYEHQLRGLGPLDYVRLCRLYLRIYQRLVSLTGSSSLSTGDRPPTPLDDGAGTLWAEIWRRLAGLVAKYYADRGWNSSPRNGTGKMKWTTLSQNGNFVQAVSDLRLDLRQQGITMAGECIVAIGALESHSAGLLHELRVALEHFLPSSLP